MSFAGFSLDAINKIQQNRDLKTSKRQKKKDGFLYLTDEPEVMPHMEVSPEKLREIKEKIRSESKKRKVKNGILAGVTIVILVLTYYFLTKDW